MILTATSPYPVLSASYKNLWEDSPEIRPELERGMLLALSGRVSRVTDPAITGQMWTVQGGTIAAGYSSKYTVWIPANKNEWKCGCEAAKFSTYAHDFFGASGHVCKHVAAVVLCFSSNTYPERPASVYSYAERLVKAQFLPALNDTYSLIGTPYRIAYKEQDGHDVIVLQCRRTRSLPIARLATFLDQRGNRIRVWAMAKDATKNYEDWVEKVKSIKRKAESTESAE